MKFHRKTLDLLTPSGLEASYNFPLVSPSPKDHFLTNRQPIAAEICMLSLSKMIPFMVYGGIIMFNIVYQKIPR